MNGKIGRLGISEYDNDRYGIGLEDEEGHFYEELLHCGDRFEVQINGKWIAVRIEWDGCWYLVGRLGKRYEMPWHAVPARR